jgi:ATP-dependent helicase/nuclease subunit B
MLQRFFLGWDRPFLVPATDWLLERKNTLPDLLVVVPTSQSGRRLREALAERAGGALLSPRIVTPGSFLQTSDPTVATHWMEFVAWLEILEETDEWSAYQELLPIPPSNESEWAGGLAQEFVKLRHTLQENGLTLTEAATRLSGTIEAGRWNALARLENRMEQRLLSWNLQSRSQVLANGLLWPDKISGIVLAGVTEMPPLFERACTAWTGPVNVLIGAPEDDAPSFSPLGRPLACWTQRSLPWPNPSSGSIRLVADSRQQAIEALRAISDAQSASPNVALGSADTTTGDELARVLTRHGWPAFHPAATPAASGLIRWFKSWSCWLADPKLTTLADLLTLPETSTLIDGQRFEQAETLARLRNDWIASRPDDLRHRFPTARFRSPAYQESARKILITTETLENWRSDFLQLPFPESLTRLLDTLSLHSPETTEQSATLFTWLSSATRLILALKRAPDFWINLMLSSIPPPSPQPPDGRVIDVQGWLELFFEPGNHLVLCGLNEGSVPALNLNDPWLGESARKLLGLPANADRAARDAFLYQAMIEARRADGRADLICAKSGSSGESLLPSRLLLACDRADLPQRVQFLFRNIEPPEAGLRWHADWQWSPSKCPAPTRIHVTSLSDYLACPFHFYLKHAVGMQSPDPDRLEWNPRDFGTIAHTLMERCGRDPEARDFTRAESLDAWLSAELNRLVTSHFGTRVPLAIRLQSEALRQRLSWLARVQTASRADGWEIIEVETSFEYAVGNSTIVGKIDRIDRHRDHGSLRIIDYKTGKISKDVESEHRKKITESTVLPAHIDNDSPAIYHSLDPEKPADYLWKNLQLPLYAQAVNDRDGRLPELCYFTLGATEADVAIHQWQNFSANDLHAARACSEWIVSQIIHRAFWPPADKPPNDDFNTLTAGKKLMEMCSPPA